MPKHIIKCKFICVKIFWKNEDLCLEISHQQIKQIVALFARARPCDESNISPTSASNEFAKTGDSHSPGTVSQNDHPSDPSDPLTTNTNANPHEMKDAYTPPAEFLDLLATLARVRERPTANTSAGTGNIVVLNKENNVEGGVENEVFEHKNISENNSILARLSAGSGSSFSLKRNQALVIKALMEHYSRIFSILEINDSSRYLA